LIILIHLSVEKLLTTGAKYSYSAWFRAWLALSLAWCAASLAAAAT
jgi:hypothetical protein